MQGKNIKYYQIGSACTLYQTPASGWKPLRMLLGLLFFCALISRPPHQSTARARGLFSVPRWWRHRGHVSDTTPQQWHVDPRGLWRPTWCLRGFRRDTNLGEPFNNRHTNKSYLPVCPAHRLRSSCFPQKVSNSQSCVAFQTLKRTIIQQGVRWKMEDRWSPELQPNRIRWHTRQDHSRGQNW